MPIAKADEPNTIAVFTFKAADRILREGGTSAWVLDRRHARKREFVVCARNARAPSVEGDEPHRAAFLVGRIAGFDRCEGHRNERWLIRFSEYAEIDVPDAWQGWRNPVRYCSLAELGIDPSTLVFKPMPSRDRDERTMRNRHPRDRMLTIEEAKRALAQTFGVKPEAIEITIRG